MYKRSILFLALGIWATGVYAEEGPRLKDESCLWEPWVDTALIGDKVVRHYPGLDYMEHLEVTAIGEDSVTVSVKQVFNKKSRPDLKDTMQRFVYSRTKYPALEEFYNAFKPAGQEKVKVKAGELACEIKEGSRIMGHSLINGKFNICRVAPCRVWLSKAVPCGGVVKMLKDYGEPFGRKIGEKAGALELAYVVVDFTHGSGERVETSKDPVKAKEPIAATIKLESPSFKDGAALPRKHAKVSYGGSISPELKWSGVPEGAKELVLICSDSDERAGGFTHWIVYGLEPKVTGLPEAMPRGKSIAAPLTAKQGVNDFDDCVYGGPQPPQGQTHKYVFEVCALDTKLDLPPGACLGQVRKAMEGHVLAKGVLSTTFGSK